MKYLFLILYRLFFLLLTLGSFMFFCGGLAYIWEGMECVLGDKILWTFGFLLVFAIIINLLAVCGALCKAKYESMSGVE